MNTFGKTRPLTVDDFANFEKAFGKEALTRAFADGRIVKASSLRMTLHVSTVEWYPDLAAASIAAISPASRSTGASPRRIANAVIISITSVAPPHTASSSQRKRERR